MKLSAINSHQQKLSVAALLTVITMLWTLYIEPHTQTLHIFITEEEWTAASCAERKRSRKKPLSKKNRMWDIEKSFWEKSGVGGLERKLGKHVSVKMVQVFYIISALYLWGCMFTTNPSWPLSLLSTYTANSPFWPVPQWCLCTNNPNQPHPTLKATANLHRNGWVSTVGCHLPELFCYCVPLPASLQELTHGDLVIWEVKSLFAQNQCLMKESIEKC